MTPPYVAATDHSSGRRGDVVVTIVLLVLLAPCALLAAFFGAFTSMTSDGCFDSELCNDRVGLGTLITMGAPILCWAASLAVSTVLITKQRLSFYVPLLGLVAWLGLVVLGLGVATSAMP